MRDTNILKTIAEDLGLSDITLELQVIKDRFSNTNSEIIIPIVGEFSSGKTTLINAITEGKKLETSSKPTTAVIYEILFGNENEGAQLFKSNAEVIEIEDVSTIKNANLEEVERVRIFDKGNNVDKNIVLVDTPGLSSNDPKHLEVLSSYLPNADALILCIDVNQQITNSLLEFIKFNNLAHLPLYLVITKTDTKTSDEIEEVKNYISRNINIPIDRMIAISSTKNELTEFYSLIENIQKSKNEIVNNVLSFRLNKTREYLQDHIKSLIENTTSDSSIETQLKQQQRQLEKLLNAVNRLISDSRSEVEEIEYEIVKGFSRVVSDKLDSIISKNTIDADQQAISAINSTCNLMMSDYQNEVRKKLYILANERKNTELGIPLRSLESINVDQIKMNPLSYDIDLSSAGQEQIKNISSGIKVVAAIGAVVATAGLASAAAPAVAGGSAVAGAAKAIGTAGTVASVADTATDIASIASNRKNRKIMTSLVNIKQHSENFKKGMNEVNHYNSQVGQMVAPNQNQGFVENIVGKVGDSVLGKPQRRKMISNYLEDSLLPEFKANLKQITNNLLQDIQNNLNNEAQLTIGHFENKLEEMKELFTKDNELFKAKIESYKNHLTLLNQ
ncbi:dynamin family protein [Flavobacterium sp. xlx-214]|uniref:dynamin family protein n=1 Tax=unclassified Flavobacterium TaxID=196869 RepID=UPI0013CFA29E|nr:MULTISPECIES: dynamin family protein [unclassified Flavobacterium]MBA5792340.1 dynamin family protein [Flavobacterium sp. xlx-221]QMI82345.1 dynamin family protein [Flavobacterium sp. xlx-214]